MTTITTIGGLTPILLETSIQAQILIPMATSIAFGELFATIVVLYLVPVSYSLYWSAGGRFSEEIVPGVSETQGEGPSAIAIADLLILKPDSGVDWTRFRATRTREFC